MSYDAPTNQDVPLTVSPQRNAGSVVMCEGKSLQLFQFPTHLNAHNQTGSAQWEICSWFVNMYKMVSSQLFFSNIAWIHIYELQTKQHPLGQHAQTNFSSSSSYKFRVNLSDCWNLPWSIETAFFPTHTRFPLEGNFTSKQNISQCAPFTWAAHE